MIHLHMQNAEWSVWTDCQEGDSKTGRCIGLSMSRTAALREAKIELQADLGQVFQMLRASIKADRINAKAEDISHQSATEIL